MLIDSQEVGGDMSDPDELKRKIAELQASILEHPDDWSLQPMLEMCLAAYHRANANKDH
jgi:hypothetical protein